MIKRKPLTEFQVDQIVARLKWMGFKPKLSVLYVSNPLCVAPYPQIGRYIITCFNGQTEEGSVVRIGGYTA